MAKYIKFSSYLWGIETLRQDVDMFSGARFSSYLWGIETKIVPAYSLFPIPRFHLTYEELKQRAISKVIVPDNYVFILPMRNWNPSGVQTVATTESFSSYLWGIETGVEFLFRLIPDHSFHLTYEELKQRYLKTFPFVFYRFHLTYEELKQSLVEPFAFYSLVFILPMRNWNFPA